MYSKKIRTFSIFLLLGIAALFVPATTLQNSIAMAQEYYPKYEEKAYYNQENAPYQSDKKNDPYQSDKKNDPYQSDKKNDPYQSDKKNDPIVNVEKKLFVCNDVFNLPENVTDTPVFFECPNPANFFFPAGPDSGEYIPCNDEICPFIDESDFGAQIFKDVATIRELSPEGTPVNLNKFHYTVTEGDIDDRITNDECTAVGFDHSTFFFTLLEDGIEFDALVCVNYVGDCEGIIYSDEVKTCTVENYIAAAAFFPPPEPEEPEDNLRSSLQQLNNQVLPPQTSSLRDIISDRTN